MQTPYVTVIQWIYQLSDRMRKKTLHDIKRKEKAKIRNRYNQVPHLTQDTLHMGKWKATRNNRTQENSEVSPFPTGDHKAAVNRHEGKDKHNNKKTVKSI